MLIALEGAGLEPLTRTGSVTSQKTRILIPSAVSTLWVQRKTSFISAVTVIYQYGGLLQIPVSTRSKAWVCYRSLAGTAAFLL